MTNEEIAELILQGPTYDPCPECAGTGRGEPGMAIIQGLDEHDNPVREEHQIPLKCTWCIATGLVLSTRFIDALIASNVSSVPPNKNVTIYEPTICPQRLKRVFEVKLVSGDGRRHAVRVFHHRTEDGDYPLNRQE